MAGRVEHFPGREGLRMSGQATTRRQVRKVENGRLTYYLEAANATFWDHHWSGVLDRSAYAGAEAGQLAWFEEPFMRYLPPTGTILEAGCGIGQYVVALRRRGYNVVGVEWAERTVERVRSIFPGIPVSAGDVTAMDVPDGTYAGYISLGVMEHRREGPEPFLYEAFRVLSPGGIAVISVPHFHPLRRIKSYLNGYTGDESGLGFYQYAYRRSEFASFIKAAGFEIIETRGYDGVKGVKDESAAVRSLLAHPRHQGKVREFLRWPFIDRTFGHMMLFVCRKPQVQVPTARPQPQSPSQEHMATTLHLGVFLTRGMSLAAWDAVGMLQREMALYRRLAERGVRVTIVSYGGADDLRYAAQFPGIGLCVNASGIDQATYEDTIEHIHATVLAQVDVFKSNQMNGADVAVRVARHFSKPVIARCGYLWSTFAGRESGPGSDTARHARAIEDAAFATADRIVVTTAAMAADVAGRFPEAADRIMVTPNYVDTDLFVPAPNHKKQWDLLFIGRLTAQKNLELLLDVVNALPVRLAVIGQGPMEASYRTHPASVSGKVDWLGRIPSEELPSHMHRSRVFVLPSLYEGHPKTLLEAMGAGMPVVGTNVPGIADVVRHEETGLLAAPETVALATVIVRVLADDVLAQRLGEAARQFIIETCSLTHIVERELGLLNELASTKNTPAQRVSESVEWHEQLDSMNDSTCVNALGAYLANRARQAQPDAGLRMLFGIEDRMYTVEGELAVRYGGGTHTKHRHMKYHDFFVARVRSGEKVLDVGCGIGAVAFDVASRCGATVTGIDLNEGNIGAARARYAHPGVTYVAGDALQLEATGAVDVIILSNVLEHIAGRPGFLRALVRMARPRRVLIRVPLFERDWRIPLRRELGVEYRLDPTHETEYTLESFAAEMHDADLRITHQEVRWGEVWAECEPDIVGERPRVSVVMSTCNNGAFLPLALESIAQQTFRDFDWIVVDDGSTDETAAILSRYADPRLRVIVHRERRGLTKSLNEAIAACKGTFIARMDGDDVALPDRLEKQVAFLDAHPSVGLAGTGFMYIDEANAVQGVERVFATDGEIRSRLLIQNCFGHGTVMMRRELCESVGGYDESFVYAQDYDLWLRLAERCEVANLPEYLYCWRKSGSSVTAAHAREQDEFAARAKHAAIARGVLPAPGGPLNVIVAQPAGVHP
jgi:glycosyltransferase involved in cell wall biosynthesis/2-polyprenyl-3-methyl-5-hydroxy-6-metoxy-1,4-benzoquinol methylase